MNRWSHSKSKLKLKIDLYYCILESINSFEKRKFIRSYVILFANIKVLTEWLLPFACYCRNTCISISKAKRALCQVDNATL